MKKITGIAVLAAAVLLVFNITKNQMVKSVVTGVLSHTTGTRVSIDKLSWGLFTQKVDIEGLRVHNPEGFSRGFLADVPRIYVHYDLGSLLGGRVRVRELIVDLRQLLVVKDKDGRLNVNSLKIAEKKEGEAAEAEKKEKKEGSRFQVDTLKLSVGRVVMKDFSRGEKPRIEVYELGIKDASTTDVVSPGQLVSFVLMQSLQKTAIQGALVYGAATVASTSFLPVGAAVLLSGKSGSDEVFDVSQKRALEAGKEALNLLGVLEKEDFQAGKVQGKVDGNDIVIDVSEAGGGKAKVAVSARKLLIPNPRIAAGVLYQIEENLS